MIDCTYLTQIAATQEPATQEAIVLAQDAVRHTFPNEYVQLLRCSNGLSVPNVVSLSLYSTDELSERNETYEVPIYLPDWLVIGDDGGGRGVFLDVASGAVYLVGLGSMLRSDAVLLASSIDDWVKQGFVLS
jgi:hypothetical protein